MKNIKTLISLLVLIGMSSCVTTVSKILTTTDTSDFASALGLTEDKNVKIVFEETADTVTISSTDVNGNATPISFGGLRLSASALGDAQKICSTLGFTAPCPSAQLA